jgi:hypothetical protein
MDMGNRPPPVPTLFGRIVRGIIRRTVKLIVIAGIVLVVVAVFVLVLGKAAQQAERNRPAPPPEQTQPAEQPDAIPRMHLDDTSPKAKADCDALITKLQGLGVFGDLKLSGGVGSVVAGPAFDGLEFSDKENFAKVALMWCLLRDSNCVVLTITDQFTGKEIGKYSVFTGFKMD